jgi:hypothetical protein
MPSDITALKSTQSWAVPVPDRKHIPAHFQAEYDKYFKHDEAPYILYNPRQDQFKNVTDEKLLCLAMDHLVVLATDHKPFECKFEDVVSLKYEELLLAFSMTITTETDEVRIDFNSACSDLFEPLMSKFRTRGDSAKDGRAEWQEMSKLSELDLKYTNYARQILRDSGNLIDSIYQAEIIAGYKILAETSLLIVTDTELCWVKNERKDWIDEPVYGGIFHFAKRSKIVDCELAPSTEPALVELLVTLKGNYQWKIPYSVDHREKLMSLIPKIKS